MSAAKVLRPLPRAQRTAQTRQRILDAALRLFAQNGYAAASLQDIADELSVAKAAVYYHYRTKQEILVAIMEPGFSAVDESMARLEAIPRAQRRDTLITDFASVVVRERRILFLTSRDPAIGAVPGVGDRIAAGEALIARVLFGGRVTLDRRFAVKMLVAVPSIVADFADESDAALHRAVVNALKRILADV